MTRHTIAVAFDQCEAVGSSEQANVAIEAPEFGTVKDRKIQVCLAEFCFFQGQSMVSRCASGAVGSTIWRILFSSSARLYRITRHRRVRLPRVALTGGEF